MSGVISGSYHWLNATFVELAEYAIRNPSDFFSYVFMIISPMLLISLVLSMFLLKEMEKKEKKLKNPMGTKRSVKAINRVRGGSKKTN